MRSHFLLFRLTLFLLLYGLLVVCGGDGRFGSKEMIPTTVVVVVMQNCTVVDLVAVVVGDSGFFLDGLSSFVRT